MANVRQLVLKRAGLITADDSVRDVRRGLSR
jgi:hypothetical protein